MPTSTPKRWGLETAFLYSAQHVQFKQKYFSIITPPHLMRFGLHDVST